MEQLPSAAGFGVRVCDGSLVGAASASLVAGSPLDKWVQSSANTHVPGPPYCTHGLRVPASSVLYVPEAQGSLPRVPTHCTYGLRVPASGVPCLAYMAHGVPRAAPTVAPQVQSCLRADGALTVEPWYEIVAEFSGEWLDGEWLGVGVGVGVGVRVRVRLGPDFLGCLILTLALTYAGEWCGLSQHIVPDRRWAGTWIDQPEEARARLPPGVFDFVWAARALLARAMAMAVRTGMPTARLRVGGCPSLLREDAIPSHMGCGPVHHSAGRVLVSKSITTMAILARGVPPSARWWR